MPTTLVRPPTGVVAVVEVAEPLFSEPEAASTTTPNPSSTSNCSNTTTSPSGSPTAAAARSRSPGWGRAAPATAAPHWPGHPTTRPVPRRPDRIGHPADTNHLPARLPAIHPGLRPPNLNCSRPAAKQQATESRLEILRRSPVDLERSPLVVDAQICPYARFQLPVMAMVKRLRIGVCGAIMAPCQVYRSRMSPRTRTRCFGNGPRPLTSLSRSTCAPDSSKRQPSRPSRKS